MKRRSFFNGLTAASIMILAGSAAFAATYADNVIGQLTKQGFHDIAVETTWLGRVRIVASRGGGQREIILNPRTGEILRDTYLAAGDGTATPILDDIAENSGDKGDDSGSGSDDGGDHSGSGGSDGGGDDHGGDDHGGSDHGGDDHGGGGGGGGGTGHDDSGHGGDDKSDDKNDDQNDDKNDDPGGKDN
jgi:hypothetical protein